MGAPYLDKLVKKYMSTTVKGIDFPLIWKTWLVGSQASRKYYSKLICCLMLEIQKNFSKPQFRSAFTVTVCTVTSTFSLADHSPPFDCLPILSNSCEE